MYSNFSSSKEMMNQRLKTLQEWCESYGVSNNTLETLIHSGYKSLDQVLRLRCQDEKHIEDLKISTNEKAILRSALYQHRINETVDRMAITSDESERMLLEQSLNQQDLQQMRKDLCMRKMQKKLKNKNNNNNNKNNIKNNNNINDVTDGGKAKSNVTRNC